MMRKALRKAQNTPQVELAATLSMRVTKCGPIASVIENRAGKSNPPNAVYGARAFRNRVLQSLLYITKWRGFSRQQSRRFGLLALYESALPAGHPA